MDFLRKYGGIIAVIALIIAIIGVYTPAGKSLVGSVTTNLTSMGLGTLAVGSGCDTAYGTCTGTEITLIKSGTLSSCTATTSIALSAQGTVECAVSGLLSTDRIFVEPGRAISNSALAIVGGFASTTANGYLEVTFVNGSSTAAVVSSTTDIAAVDYIYFR